MPSIGKDLVKIRKHLGLTLQDIQFATKLPQHTLEKIENDTIFVDAEEGPIYTRNFVRSYGRVLKIEDDVLIKALDQRENEKYNHLLLEQYPELAKELTRTEKKATSSDKDSAIGSAFEGKEDGKDFSEAPVNKNKIKSDTGERNDESPSTINKEQEKTDSVKISEEKKAESQKASRKTSTTAISDPVNTKTSKKGGTAEKSTKEIDWADVGKKINQKKRPMPVWVVGLIILVIILGAAGYFIIQSGLLSDESALQDEITTPPDQGENSSLSIELDEPEITEETPSTPEPVAMLDDTLSIVIYAAFGNIDPVRVWSDTKPRFDPYWIEEGNAMIFDFENSVQVRGPYDNMLFFLNGHLIENAVQNFYNEEEDYVELNRSDFTSDSKWSENTDLQIPGELEPPEEIRSRPTFN